MMENINVKEWSARLTKLPFQTLKCKPLISLQSRKISDGTYFKVPGFKIISCTKPKNMVVHSEDIGLQKDVVKRELKSILLRIEKDLHGIYLLLALILSCLTDENMNYHLKQVAFKHSQISSNIKTHDLGSFNNVDNPLSDDSRLTLRKIIMDIKEEDGERCAVAITCNWRKVMECWVKRSM